MAHPSREYEASKDFGLFSTREIFLSVTPLKLCYNGPRHVKLYIDGLSVHYKFRKQYKRAIFSDPKMALARYREIEAHVLSYAPSGNVGSWEYDA